MKIVLFGNGNVALNAVKWFRQQDEEIVAIVLHSESSRRMGNEIIAASGLPPARIFDGSLLRNPETIRSIRALNPDIGLSIFFGYILKKELLDLFPKGCLNLHPALLPFNRGAYPNVWSIVDGTPAGVTIHYVDEGVDTGDILAQREVGVEPIDTGETLYRKLEAESLKLLSQAWPMIREGRATRMPQQHAGATAHRLKDVESIDEIDLNREYKGGELLDVLRARTFPPYPGAYFVANGRKVFVNVELKYEDAGD